MATVIELKDKAALLAHARTLLEPFGVEVNPEDLYLAPYFYDGRTGWDTWIVKLKGYGVLGFTNGPLE